MILLDTHVLIWWVGAESLPRPVQNLIQKNHKAKTIAVSAMSFWEIAMLVKKGRLRLNYDLETWTSKVLSLDSLSVIAPDPHILMTSVFLDGFHPDPADRIIVATALSSGATLVTKDAAILKYPGVKSFWGGR